MLYICLQETWKSDCDDLSVYDLHGYECIAQGKHCSNRGDKGGTTAIVEKYRNLLKKTKQARVGQIILSGILPVFGNRIRGYRNSKRVAVNGMVKRLCKEEELGYADLWDSFVGKEEMYVRDGLHLSGKGLPFLPRDCQGRLPVAWVKYDI